MRTPRLTIQRLADAIQAFLGANPDWTVAVSEDEVPADLLLPASAGEPCVAAIQLGQSSQCGIELSYDTERFWTTDPAGEELWWPAVQEIMVAAGVSCTPPESRVRKAFMRAVLGYSSSLISGHIAALKAQLADPTAFDECEPVSLYEHFLGHLGAPVGLALRPEGVAAAVRAELAAAGATCSAAVCDKIVDFVDGQIAASAWLHHDVVACIDKASASADLLPRLQRYLSPALPGNPLATAFDGATPDDMELAAEILERASSNRCGAGSTLDALDGVAAASETRRRALAGLAAMYDRPPQRPPQNAPDEGMLGCIQALRHEALVRRQAGIMTAAVKAARGTVNAPAGRRRTSTPL